MTAQEALPGALLALGYTVTSGQSATIEIETEGGGSWLVALDAEDVGILATDAGYHRDDDCECPDDEHVDGALAGKLFDILGELHRLAHNGAGDTDDPERCHRFPCRRLREIE